MTCDGACDTKTPEFIGVSGQCHTCHTYKKYRYARGAWARTQRKGECVRVRVW